jgi:hypothetical protein
MVLLTMGTMLKRDHRCVAREAQEELYLAPCGAVLGPGSNGGREGEGAKDEFDMSA